MNYKRSIALLGLLISTLAHSTEIESVDKSEELFVGHYIGHLITDAGARIVGGSIVGIQVAAFIMAKANNCLNERNKAILSATSLASFAAVVSIVYKTPQWTDTYLLKKEKKRSTKQNIYVFLHRTLLSSPLGVLTGEYFTH